MYLPYSPNKGGCYEGVHCNDLRMCRHHDDRWHGQCLAGRDQVHQRDRRSLRHARATRSHFERMPAATCRSAGGCCSHCLVPSRRRGGHGVRPVVRPHVRRSSTLTPARQLCRVLLPGSSGKRGDAVQLRSCLELRHHIKIEGRQETYFLAPFTFSYFLQLAQFLQCEFECFR